MITNKDATAVAFALLWHGLKDKFGEDLPLLVHEHLKANQELVADDISTRLEERMLHNMQASKSYWMVVEIASGAHAKVPGVSSAPHLYRTKGIAEARRKTKYRPEAYRVVEVKLEEA